MSITIAKIKRSIRAKIVGWGRKKPFYVKLYKSYWHSRLFSAQISQTLEQNYFTAIPNPGAGIGHQLANWIAGYWFARQFGLKFAHSPFSSSTWEHFLGFGYNEPTIETLIKKGYHKVTIPLFKETNEKEVDTIKDIIRSYANGKVVFVAEQDQYYKAQFGVMKEIKSKFYNAPARKNDKLVYKSDYCNVAVHVRRGDIVTEGSNKIHNKSLRFQGNSYFEEVLSNTLKNIKSSKPIAVYLFSQGSQTDFTEFEKYENMHFCLDMSAIDSFNHMVHADVLITSRSSFSYKAALLNNGLKICPETFWHGYPLTSDFILANEDGQPDWSGYTGLKSGVPGIF